MGQAETLQDQGNTWVVLVPSGNPEEKGVSKETKHAIKLTSQGWEAKGLD